MCNVNTLQFRVNLISVLIYVTNFQRLHSITHRIILIRVDLSFKKSLFNEMYPNTCTNVTLLLFLEAETINCPHEGCNFFTKFKHILKNHISGKHTNTVSKSNYLFMCVTKNTEYSQSYQH